MRMPFRLVTAEAGVRVGRGGAGVKEGGGEEDQAHCQEESACSTKSQRHAVPSAPCCTAKAAGAERGSRAACMLMHASAVRMYRNAHAWPLSAELRVAPLVG